MKLNCLLSEINSFRNKPWMSNYQWKSWNYNEEVWIMSRMSNCKIYWKAVWRNSREKEPSVAFYENRSVTLNVYSLRKCTTSNKSNNISALTDPIMIDIIPGYCIWLCYISCIWSILLYFYHRHVIVKMTHWSSYFSYTCC